jgi:hypothetical protein
MKHKSGECLLCGYKRINYYAALLSYADASRPLETFRRVAPEAAELLLMILSTMKLFRQIKRAP